MSNYIPTCNEESIEQYEDFVAAGLKAEEEMEVLASIAEGTHTAWEECSVEAEEASQEPSPVAYSIVMITPTGGTISRAVRGDLHDAVAMLNLRRTDFPTYDVRIVAHAGG